MVTKTAGAARWPHLVIRASAGSGKTFRLSNRYLELIAASEPADTILASTFTRAAAAEIQDRVLLRLAKAALDDGERKGLAGFLKAGHGSVPELSRDRCLDLLAQLTRQLHRLRVGTLDSFFIQIARSFAWELGLPAHWRIVDDLEDQRLRDEAIAQLLASEERQTLTQLVNWLTKGEAQRSLGDLLDDTVAKLYDLFREAPKEAWFQIARPKGLDPESLAATLDALEHVPLPNHKSIAKARQNDLEILHEGLWEEFPLKGIASKVLVGEDIYYGKQLDPQTIEVYERLLQHASSVFLGKLAAQTEATFELLERFRLQYERLKRKSGGMLFADVTQLVGAWFDQRRRGGKTSKTTSSVGPVSLEQVGFRLDAHLNHLLLDEFQDTSLSQWNVLRPLAERITSSTSGTSFFCVGDGKQAIYGWRGGIAEIFEALDEQLSGLRHDPLNESRRSAPPIITTVNRVFQGMTRHDRLERTEEGVRLWSEAFPEHTTALTDMPGYVTLEAGPDTSEIVDDDKPLLTHAAQRIFELTQQAPGRSIGVLVRSNATIAELIFRLRKLGVPASEEGGNPLVDSAAVQLVMSALEFADHPGHSIARYHLEQSTLGKLLGIPATGSPPSRDAAVARDIRRRLLSDGYGRTIERWAETLAPECDARDCRRLLQLVSRAYEQDAEATLRPRDFVAAVETERAADPTTADVRVTTVHKSKGLQYDIVVLPDLTTSLLGQPDGYVAGRSSRIGPVEIVCRHVRQELRPLLPPRLAELFDEHDRQDTFESLCVLYVALTRAVHALHLIVPATAGGEKQGLPRTFAGLLRAALTDGQPLAPLAVAYAEGDPDWFERAKKAVTKRVEPPPALEVRLAQTTGPRRRGLERVAPSELEGGRRVRLSGPTSGDGLLARQRGTLLHAWFEKIRWLNEGTPSDEDLRSLANQVLDAAVSDSQLVNWIETFRESLRTPAIEALLSPAYYEDLRTIGIEPRKGKASEKLTLEVFNERRFAIRQDDQLVSGILDRLVVVRRGGKVVAADVVDFKTDAIDAADPKSVAAKVEFYRPQLAAYREAVAQTYGLESQNVGARLVLLSVARVERIER